MSFSGLASCKEGMVPPPSRRKRTIFRSMSLSKCVSSIFSDSMDEYQVVEKRDWEVLDPTKISIGPLFATGSSGKIYHGIYDGKAVAVKILHEVTSRIESEKSMREFMQEVTALSILQHRNVLKLIGAFWKGDSKYIVTEFMRGGSVCHFLHKQSSPLPVRRVAEMALDVAQGMEYLHSRGIIHRDLKSENLLLDGNGVVKIVDFGISRFARPDMDMTAETGTYRWMAPEVIEGKHYDAKVDVYSFGIVLWELLTRERPYGNMSVIQTVFAVVQKNMRPCIPPECPPDLREVMQACWLPDPKARPSFCDIVISLRTFLKTF